MTDWYKSKVGYCTLGEYIKRLNPDDRIYIISDSFYISAFVYTLRSDLRSILRFECAFNEHYPFTVYI